MNCFLKDHKYFATTITLMGLFFGFSAGNLLYVLIYSVTGWESFLGAIAILLIGILTGTLFAYFYRKNEVFLNIQIALLGGFNLARGLAMIMGSWPIDSV